MAKLIKHSTTQLSPGQATPDGDFDARKARVYVQAANQDVVVFHGLGRVPRHVECTWKDGFADWKIVRDARGIVQMDSEKAVMQFSAANVTLDLRFA